MNHQKEHSNTFFIDDVHRTNRGKEAQRRTRGKMTTNMSRHDLIRLSIKTEAQHHAVHALKTSDTVMLYGSAGTGKTFLAMHYAIEQILDPESNYSKVVIMRSVVPTRDVGFLPGTLEEKIAVFEKPYERIVTELTGHATGYEKFKERGAIEFEVTSFLRGTTFHDAIIIFDEFQSATFHEIDTVVTRVGDNCKLILCGDARQNDLNKKKEVSGFDDIYNVFEAMPSVSLIEFTSEDIVRSGFVREYIITKEKLRIT